MSKLANELLQAAQEREQRRAEQWDAVRQWEASLTTRRPPAPEAPAVPAQAPASDPAVIDRWEQELRQCQARMMELERAVSDGQAQLDSLQAAAATKTQSIAKLQEELQGLRQQVDSALQAHARVAQERLVWAHRLEALRECQGLAHTVRLAEEEWRGAQQAAARLADAHAKLAEELTSSQRRSAELQGVLEQSRARLGQALARASAQGAS